MCRFSVDGEGGAVSSSGITDTIVGNTILGAFESQTVQSNREIAELRARLLGLDLERQELQKRLAELALPPSSDRANRARRDNAKSSEVALALPTGLINSSEIWVAIEDALRQTNPCRTQQSRVIGPEPHHACLVAANIVASCRA